MSSRPDDETLKVATAITDFASIYTGTDFGFASVLSLGSKSGRLSTVTRVHRYNVLTLSAIDSTSQGAHAWSGRSEYTTRFLPSKGSVATPMRPGALATR